MQQVDRWTVAGLGLLLMPLMTMWHEIGGHAAACVAQGGHVSSIGAFYVQCDGLAGRASAAVAAAGVTLNAVTAIIVYRIWRGAKGDTRRLTLWLLWVAQGFVASGYFLFSGVSGFGDLGIGKGGSLAGFGLGLPFRLAEIAIGVGCYVLIVRHAIRCLNDMIGQGPDTRRARRSIAHVFYLSAGAGAVLVGLLNPVGIVITIMSAAASSFGGLAGFISIGYAAADEGEAKSFVLSRNPAVIVAGLVVVIAFAVVLGPSLHFA